MVRLVSWTGWVWIMVISESSGPSCDPSVSFPDTVWLEADLQRRLSCGQQSQAVAWASGPRCHARSMQLWFRDIIKESGPIQPRVGFRTWAFSGARPAEFSYGLLAVVIIRRWRWQHEFWLVPFDALLPAGHRRSSGCRMPRTPVGRAVLRRKVRVQSCAAPGFGTCHRREMSITQPPINAVPRRRRLQTCTSS
jgi:hypothetical protein